MSTVRGSGNDLESRHGHPRDQRLIDSGHFFGARSRRRGSTVSLSAPRGPGRVDVPGRALHPDLHAGGTRAGVRVGRSRPGASRYVC